MSTSVAVSSFKGALELFKRTSEGAAPSSATMVHFFPDGITQIQPEVIYNDPDPSVSLDQRKLLVLQFAAEDLVTASKTLITDHEVLVQAQERSDKIFRSQTGIHNALEADVKRLKGTLKNLGDTFETDFTEYAMARGFAVPSDLLTLIVQFIDEHNNGVAA